MFSEAFAIAVVTGGGGTVRLGDESVPARRGDWLLITDLNRAALCLDSAPTGLSMVFALPAAR